MFVGEKNGPVKAMTAQRKKQRELERDAERYRWLRFNGCVWADSTFHHADGVCTAGRVAGAYADSFVDQAMRRVIDRNAQEER